MVLTDVNMYCKMAKYKIRYKDKYNEPNISYVDFIEAESGEEAINKASEFIGYNRRFIRAEVVGIVKKNSGVIRTYMYRGFWNMVKAKIYGFLWWVVSLFVDDNDIVIEKEWDNIVKRYKNKLDKN